MSSVKYRVVKIEYQVKIVKYRQRYIKSVFSVSRNNGKLVVKVCWQTLIFAYLTLFENKAISIDFSFLELGFDDLGLATRKPVLEHMRTAKAQIRLVSSGHSLSANRIIAYCTVLQWRANARMRLCACEIYFESAQYAHARRRHFFA